MIARSHPLARRLRALRRDRAARDAEGVFVAEGMHLTLEALASGAQIELAVAAPRLAADPAGRALLERLGGRGIPVHEASDQLMNSLQEAHSPQPVLAVVRRRLADLDAVVRGRPGAALLVIACGLQDPGNLGAVVRTSDAAGATGLVATPGGADLHHPRAVRATAGSIFRLPVVEAEAAEAIARASRAGLAIYGAAPGRAEPYDAVDWTAAAALVIGAEGAGLPAEIVPLLARTIAIPMTQGVESLSVGAAAAVILFEAARMRRTGTS
jgi:RNA methyltransferase, TrmH family